VSPHYDSVQQVKGSHKYLITQALKEVVFKYIFINVTKFHGTPKLMRTLNDLPPHHIMGSLEVYINRQNPKYKKTF